MATRNEPEDRRCFFGLFVQMGRRVATRVIADDSLGRFLCFAALLVLTLSSTGCSMGPPRMDVATAIRRVHGFECPSYEIRLVDSVERGHNKVYAFEACGVPVELQEELALPRSTTIVKRVAPPQTRSLDARLAPPVPPWATRAIKGKVKEICELIDVRSANWQGPPSFPADWSLAECPDRLLSSLKQLGGEFEAEARVWHYWFAGDGWAFDTVTTLEAPACGAFLNDDSREACHCLRKTGQTCHERAAERRNELVSATKSGRVRPHTGAGEPSGPRLHDGFYLRADVGFGILTAEHPSFASKQEFSGTHAEFAASLGGSPTPGLVLGVSFGNQRPFADAGTTIYVLSLITSIYPWPRLGFHLDGSLGVGLMYPAEQTTNSSEAGALIGAGGGYDFWLGDQTSLGLGARIGHMFDGTEEARALTATTFVNFTYH
ncbi:MAG TPA: hypothetical protein VIM73_11270 [Polyangiaceae bacterium]